jgi:hypothetical protein
MRRETKAATTTITIMTTAAAATATQQQELLSNNSQTDSTKNGTEERQQRTADYMPQALFSDASLPVCHCVPVRAGVGRQATSHAWSTAWPQRSLHAPCPAQSGHHPVILAARTSFMPSSTTRLWAQPVSVSGARTVAANRKCTGGCMRTLRACRTNAGRDR